MTDVTQSLPGLFTVLAHTLSDLRYCCYAGFRAGTEALKRALKY